MIISNKQVQNILKAYGDQSKVNKPAKSGAASGIQKQDEVILSSQAQEFSQILSGLKSMPEIRQDKVAELTAEINSGTYRVDAKEIADKMVDRSVADGIGRM